MVFIVERRRPSNTTLVIGVIMFIFLFFTETGIALRDKWRPVRQARCVSRICRVSRT